MGWVWVFQKSQNAKMRPTTTEGWKTGGSCVGEKGERKEGERGRRPLRVVGFKRGGGAVADYESRRVTSGLLRAAAACLQAAVGEFANTCGLASAQ